MRGNSRSLRHLPQSSTNTDVGPPQTEGSRPPPAQHAPRRRWLESQLTEERKEKCSCVDVKKPHVKCSVRVTENKSSICSETSQLKRFV